jgi:hypothetical protein
MQPIPLEQISIASQQPLLDEYFEGNTQYMREITLNELNANSDLGYLYSKYRNYQPQNKERK